MDQTREFQELLRAAEKKIAVSLAVSLYFEPDPEAFKKGVLQAYEVFLERCEPLLRWYADETGKRFRDATSEVLRIPFDRVPEAMDNLAPYSWTAFAGQQHGDAASCQFEARLKPEGAGGRLGYVRAAFPVNMFIEEPERFVALARTLSAPVPVVHGVAGFSFTESMVTWQRQTNDALLVPLAMRFSGIEVEGFGASGTCCMDAIKGVNWLTFLSSRFIDRLGGAAAVRSQLGGDILVHPMPWGLLLQAGPRPEIGDLNAGERLPLYRRVSKVLRSVRVGRHWNLGVEFREEATKRWIERFDD